ncbi:hypothetical protein Pla163_34470 [Planctomycetes bacterium Pla163]|uniref:Uncharacterized protein n=1 Tax=Rohdeia mirabilis TaxID=2528008 RepID=A0A518D4A2_9BACT|nr:hypothetical protein Pla163_34470 [Planctomycetes bacterium Pla163]
MALRLIEGIPVDRARLRLTAQYQLTDRLSVGIEANPKDDDYGLLANYLVWTETDARPALMVGTSSDRIGTPDGRAYFATLSKNLRQATGLPISPYLGTAYGEFDDELVLIGGLRIDWAERFSTTTMWDSDNLHHTADYVWENGWRTGVVVIEQDGDHYVGLSIGTSF